MDARESEHLFKEADRLYREARYGEALRVLDQLDRAFPNTKNIQMPAAMCLAHLGQVDKARAIYERLAQQHPVERLEKLRGVIEHAEAQAAVTAPMDALDAVLNVNLDNLGDSPIPSMQPAQPAAPAPKAAPEGPAWGKWAAIGGGVAVLLALLSLPLFVQSDGQRTAPERPQLTVISADTMEDIAPDEWMRLGMVFLFIIVPLSLLALPVPILLTLHFFGEMPRETPLGNFFFTLGIMFLIYFVCNLVFGCLGAFIPGAESIGYWIAVLLCVNKIFELGFARTMIFMGFTVAVSIVQIPVYTVILRMFYFDLPMRELMLGI